MSFRSLSRQEFVSSGVCLSGVCLSGVCLSGVCHGTVLNINLICTEYCRPYNEAVVDQTKPTDQEERDELYLYSQEYFKIKILCKIWYFLLHLKVSEMLTPGFLTSSTRDLKCGRFPTDKISWIQTIHEAVYYQSYCYT